MGRATTSTDDRLLRAVYGPSPLDSADPPTAPGPPLPVDALMAGCLQALGRRSASLLPRDARTYMCPADLVQDILLKTWRLAPHLHAEEETGLQRYLHRALTNRARTESRRIRRRNYHDRHFAMPAHADAPSPLDRALTSERERALRAALAALRPRDRQLVIGRHVLDWPWSQVAAVFGFDSADSARIAGSRARQRLARHLASAS